MSDWKIGEGHVQISWMEDCLVHVATCGCAMYSDFERDFEPHLAHCRRKDAECTCWKLCTCELKDISQPGEIRFVRGEPRGCRIHESEADRQAREQAEAAEAEREARYWAAVRRAREA